MKVLIVFLVMLISANCTKEEDPTTYDKQTLTKSVFIGVNLRTDGYYYVTSLDQKRLDVYFLYRNGTLLYAGGGIERIDISQYEQRFNKTSYNSRGWWGLFNVSGDSIKFERWYPGNWYLYGYISEGLILNDTTFHIRKSHRSNGTELRDKDETYIFKKFSPKPDSTNVFIK